MLIHLGHGVSVHDADMITMTDLQRDVAPDTQALLRTMRGKGLVRTLGASPKTLVICREGRKTVCYLSCVGLRTLRDRMENSFERLTQATRTDDL